MNISSHIIDLIDPHLTEMGGKGSGNWSHKGRKGKRGGSLPTKGVVTKKSPPTNSTFREGVIRGPSIRSINNATRNLPQEHLDTISSITYERLDPFVSMQAFPDGSIELNESGSVKTGDLIHEIGHSVLFHDKRYGIVGDPNKYDRVFRRIYKEKAQAVGYKYPKEMETAYKRGKLKRKAKGFPTGYSMANHHELFAESYEMFVKSPEYLQKHVPEIYDYMRDTVFDGVEYTK